MSKQDSVVLVGRIAGPHGIKGWLKVSSDTQPADNILDYAPWQLRHAKSGAVIREAEVLDGRLHGKGLVVKLAGVADRDEASALQGLDIAVPRSRLPEIDDGSYYWADLEGLRVTAADGRPLGVVDHMRSAGAADVMAVRSTQDDSKRMVFIPFIRGEVILAVDLDAGVIRVNWDEAV
jgi:16S rRNA processing protein RimM